jgi:hypothetical protein
MAGAFIFVPSQQDRNISGPNRASYRGKLVILFLLCLSIYLYVGTESASLYWISRILCLFSSLAGRRRGSGINGVRTLAGHTPGRLYFSFSLSKGKAARQPVITRRHDFHRDHLLLPAVESFSRRLGLSHGTSAFQASIDHHDPCGKFFNNGSA